MEHRLQKLISNAGVASRRKAEILLKEGRVLVNGEKAYLGDKANPDRDQIVIDGKIISQISQDTVILLNKPKGIITTCHDPQGRKTAISLLPNKIRVGLHPVGRLDQDSRGALLLTNNGELTLKLTHPKYSHRKTYLVWVKGFPSKSIIQKWEKGIILDMKKTIPAKVDLLALSNQKKQALLKVILKEGRNRQIRRVADKLGHPVIDLQRIAIADIYLNNLKEGNWRELEKKEWLKLLS